ncbi:MAG TPA: TIGR03557 family F420-dependent LLM class oxidoreductase [Thermodesulfobacteriota bacterium]|nr:TIGR03557 family F420-dependent LLM class oxidoreductase [Thermodesulfobacteriota bacterium]
MKFGYKLMSEEHGPVDLVRNARRAEEAGFDFVAISDHFHPWLNSQGHSPFAWSVLGGVAAQTELIGIVTAVTCPILRYHPAIIAQAAATIAIMSGGRFTLRLGAGEQLNEHVVGRGWPPVYIRHEMLAEAIDIIRLLWQKGMHSYRGRHLTLQDGQVFDLPDQPPLISVAISGPSSAKVAAEKGDGVFASEPDAQLINYWQRAGGNGPRYAEVGLCWAPSEDEAIKTAHERFRFGATGWKVMAELPNLVNFEAATRWVRPEDIKDSIACGPNVERHIAAVQKFLNAGFDHIILIGVGPDQEGFLGFWKEQLAPRLRELV